MSQRNREKLLAQYKLKFLDIVVQSKFIIFTHLGHNEKIMFSHHHVWDFIPLAKTLIFESIPEILLQRLHGAHPNNLQFSSVTSDSWQPHEPQHARLHCPSPTPGAYSDSCLSSHLCHPTISSSVVPFSSCLQSFSASGSFPMSQFLASDGQTIGVSASASILPMNIQDWFPLGWTGWICLQSEGLSRVLSNTTVQKHRFFGTQLSL